MKLVATIDTIQTWSSKGVKRKHDDNDDGNALTIFWKLLTHKDENNENDENDQNEYGEDNKDSQDDENMDDKRSWINCWIDKPPSEGGRRDKEGCPGWGKPEILKTAGITEAQYNRYMVSFHVSFAVGLIDLILPRCPHTICVLSTSTPRRHSATMLCFIRLSMGSSSKK